ncbi:ABC transporter, permease protein, putative [Reinekea sp. MED297]|uniref:ABC transporter, permease protein, putative n=2 Tax=Reinekea TaxID=230494 RepID=A4BKL5_9GAMM|nr:ABC transporter, permease protein, putative [Reinekea sp. MED297] [Reinekea blandensis MED297]
MLKLAFRNILRNKRRTILTMLSMFGGYVLLTLSISVQNGSYVQVIDFFTRDSTGHAQISEVGYQDKPTLYKSVPETTDFYQQLMQVDGVQRATPRIVSSALAYGETKSFPVQVIGVDVEKEARMSFLEEKVKTGQYLEVGPDSDGYYSALIGAAVARQLSLEMGDELILISQGADGSMANDLYRVVGVVGSTEGAEARNVYLPLAAAQSFFVMPEQAHYWAVLTSDYERSDQLSQRLNSWLDGDSELEAVTWKVVSKEFYETMKADVEGGYVAYYIIIFLVCIGVLNTVLMSVLERTGEFGVLKAIGTSPGRVFTLIVTETLMLAVLSCLAGLIVAMPINYYLAAVGFVLPEPMEVSGVIMSHMKGLWDVKTFMEPALIVIGSAALISLFPARRAAKIVPVDAMRSL